MRATLYEAVADIAAKRDDVAVVTADMGSFKRFREIASGRFFNVGVAEQFSVSFAAGLASEGYKVFLYTVAGFTLYRAWEQLKFTVGYWRQDVTVLGTGFGWRYFLIGRGHRTPDDLALMRLIPNMRALAPATDASLRAMIADPTPGPRFIRLGEGLPSGPPPPSTGTVVAVGLGEAWARLRAPVQTLRAQGADLGLVAIEDLDGPEVVALAASGRPLLVVEEHVAIGGLGDALRRAGGYVAGHKHLPINVDLITASEDDLLAAYGFRACDLEEWLQRQLNHYPASAIGSQP